MARLRATIVGAGLISQKKHIPAFQRIKDSVELVAICDVNLEAAKKAASAFGIPRFYDDLTKMLESERPDMVDICTPPRTHANVAVTAARHGCHLLIEKPMALTVQDCQAIIDAARLAGTKICVGHSDLFYPPFWRARDMVARGEIGEFRGMRIFLATPTDYMTSVEGHWAHKLPGGVIGETGPHIIYMTLAFINPIREVSVNGLKLMPFGWSQFEDYRIDLIGDNTASSILLTYATNQWAAQVDLIGSDGILKLDLQDLSLIRYKRPNLKPVSVGVSLLDQSAQLIGHSIGTLWRFSTKQHRTTHDLYIRQFVDAIRNDRPSPVPGEEGLETVRVLNMVVANLESRYESVTR